MTLPVRDLDDRLFQDIVDEAKRRIPRYCPGWTDHNVSDPGVAIVELLAWMTEMTLFRLNQVPDRMYVKFLELIGVELAGPTPATTDLLFDLAGPATGPVLVPAATEAATDRIGDEEPLVFLTNEPLHLDAPALSACTTVSGGREVDQWSELVHEHQQVTCFPALSVGDAVNLGFVNSLRRHLLRLQITTGPEGAGSDPQRPPLRWESWSGQGWTPLRVLADSTGGLNRPGEVTLLVGPDHEPLTLAGSRAHWLRCVLTEPPPNAPTYAKSPVLQSVDVHCLGGVARAHHGEPVGTELLGTSSGEPGQVFQVRRSPVLPLRGDESVRVVPSRHDEPSDPQQWTVVREFAETGPSDRVFTWAGATGEVRFGPRVVDADGSVRQFGAVPSAGSQVFVTGYRVGGGVRGNVDAGAVSVLRRSLPGVAGVRNLDRAEGGVDTESIENAKARGPLHLQGGHRAVTASDFEHQALAASPRLARARCLAPRRDGDPVRVLLVPRTSVIPRALTVDDLAVPADVEESVRQRLDERRILTTTVSLEVPQYQGVKVVVRLQVPGRARWEVVEERAENALYRFVNPVVGGVDGAGWPFGVDLHSFDVARLLTAELGEVVVRRIEFYGVDWSTNEEEEEPHDRVRLADGALPMSFRHAVVLER